jgi:NADP-dependent 3-hydroxy acid dehydrogenase YdfG
MASKIAEEHDRLEILVSNAGIGTTLPGDGERMESRDGYELRFAVNYLAGFLPTRLLEPLLVAAAPSRIVNVSSAGQMAIEFDDVMLEHEYGGTACTPRRSCRRRSSSIRVRAARPRPSKRASTRRCG